MVEKTFVAFFSYVHDDDKHDNGRLTAIRQWLEGEISAQTGEPFEIFQDREDIHWGHAWEERINGVLDGCTFLIAVVTPRYLKSQYCRKEFERFIEREKILRRNDLILPVLYMDTPALSVADDSVAAAISSRQYADWRSLRFEPWTNPDVTKRLAQMAKIVYDVMLRETQSTPIIKTVDEKSLKSTTIQHESSASNQSMEPEILKPATIKEPPTLIVDPMPRRGDHTSITRAIEFADPGTRILIRSGLYKESLMIDKPLELIGDGARDEIVIESMGTSTIQFKTEFGRVANLTLRQVGGGKSFGVDILQGRLELEDCDITSQSLGCVAIHGGADPRLRRNDIHDGKEGGVFVWENARGTLEDNDIYNNALAGVEIKTGGDPTLRRNRIYDGKQGGIMVCEDGAGTIEDNDIYNNALAGVEIRTGGKPTLRRNRIHDGKEDGIMVWDNGAGTIVDNDIYNNTFSGVEIKIGGDPTLRRNRIYDGKQCGIMVWEDGAGTIEDNDIYNNTFSGVEIKTGGNPILRRNRIHNGKQVGIMVWEDGVGTIEDNDIYNNTFSGVEIKTGGDPILRRNRIYDGKQGGVLVHEKGRGTLEDNDIYNNTLAGVEIRYEGDSILRRNRIYNGKENGVLVDENGRGTLENNEIYGNGYAGVEVRRGGDPTLRHNIIANNEDFAAYIHDNGSGFFQDNDLRNNKKGTWLIDDSSKSNVKADGNVEE